jgi:Flp pilus assembly protein TadD
MQGWQAQASKLENSQTLCDQAIKLDPQLATAYYSKAVSLEALGRTQEAEQARKKARELGYTG